MSELLDVIYEASSFWRLNQCGRARVLMKFAAQFAEAEAVPVRFYAVETGFDDFLALSIRPVWDAEKSATSIQELQKTPPDRCILYEFLSSAAAKKMALPFLTGPSWTDPRRTRSARFSSCSLRVNSLRTNRIPLCTKGGVR